MNKKLCLYFVCVATDGGIAFTLSRTDGCIGTQGCMVAQAQMSRDDHVFSSDV